VTHCDKPHSHGLSDSSVRVPRAQWTYVDDDDDDHHHQCRDRLSVAILQYVHQPRPIYLTHTSGNQPYVSLLDSRQQIRSGACGADGTCYDVVHQVTALIYNNPGCSILHGKNIVETVSFNTHVRARWRA
jgi:hypothetical protein